MTDQLHQENDEEQLPEMLQPVQYPGPESEPGLVRGKGKEAYSFAQITQTKAAKKVIAPFIRTTRKFPKKVPDITDKESEAARHKAVSYLNERLSVTIKVLQTYCTAENINLPGALYDTTDMLKSTTNSAVAVLYIVDTANGELYQSPRHVQSPRHKVNWSIKEGSTVACHVAATKTFIWTGDILADPRFPEGVGWSGLSSTIKAVICAPILSPENEIIAIIELCRDVFQHNYTRADVQIVVALAAWMGAGIYQNQLRLTLLSQQQLSSRLLEFINLYFCDINISDIKILSDIMIYAKQVLQAERTGFYLIDQNSVDQEADYYIQVQDDPNQIFKKKTRLKLAKIRSVAGYVARTRQPLNARDVMDDVRFKDTDKNSSEITRTALCEPIMDKTAIAGVIILINKKDNGYFTAMDEATFRIFSNYCALSLHHFQVRKELKEKKNKLIITREILDHQMQACDHDLKRLKLGKVKLPKNILEFSWFPKVDHLNILDEIALALFQKVCSDRFMTKNNVNNFILVVKRMYRNNPYHTFEHACLVLHGMFNILIRCKKIFSDFEKDAMMIAAFTSNIDNRGLNNNYYYIFHKCLSSLYKDSSLQNHHIYVTRMVLKKCQMFTYLSEFQHTAILDEIDALILHTDMENHLRCRNLLKNVLNHNAFDWDELQHRFLLKGIIMVSCSQISRTKPLPVNEKLTVAELTEIIKQNEENKKMGLTPYTGMNRDSAFTTPEDEYQFLTSVVIPLNELLVILLPTTKEILDCSILLRNSWNELVDFKGKRLWRPEESLPVGLHKPAKYQ